MTRDDWWRDSCWKMKSILRQLSRHLLIYQFRRKVKVSLARRRNYFDNFFCQKVRETQMLRVSLIRFCIVNHTVSRFFIISLSVKVQIKLCKQTNHYTNHSLGFTFRLVHCCVSGQTRFTCLVLLKHCPVVSFINAFLKEKIWIDKCTNGSRQALYSLHGDRT